MAKPDDLSRSLVPFEQSSTLVAVIEMSLSSWFRRKHFVSEFQLR